MQCEYRPAHLEFPIERVRDELWFERLTRAAPVGQCSSPGEKGGNLLGKIPQILEQTEVRYVPYVPGVHTAEARALVAQPSRTPCCLELIRLAFEGMGAKAAS